MAKNSKEQLEQAAGEAQPNEAQPESAPSGEVAYPAVVVAKVPSPDGDTVQVAAINGLDPLAVPSILKLAVKLQEKQLGL